MSERATKLFRLLINPATADGERRNAAAMLNQCMESEGIEIADIAWIPPEPVYIRVPIYSTPTPRKERKRIPKTIPFGKYKGYPWDEIPSAYLSWILDGMTDPQEWLVRAVTIEMERRGEL